MNDGYCDNCKKKVPIWIRERTMTLKHTYDWVSYDEAYAICQFCGKEVYDPKINDMNVERRAYVLSANQTWPFMKQNKKRHAKTSM